MASWIRVEDRLPDKYGEYLVVYKHGLVTTEDFYDTELINACKYEIVDDSGKYIFDRDDPNNATAEPGFYMVLDDCDIQDVTDNITHWMPLPEHPSEVKTNVFTDEEIYPNCTVQILKNPVTGETSVGWWPNDTQKQVAEGSVGKQTKEK